jgi:hypothetical protein
MNRSLSLSIGILGLALASCTRATTPPVEVRTAPEFATSVGKIAVVGIAPSVAASETSEVDERGLASVTAVVASSASRIGSWRVVPPEDIAVVADAASNDSGAARAGRIATAAKADAVLVAEVTRFHERVGGNLGVSEPASVALRLMLVPAGASAPIWTADYAHTQQPLTYNLWNFWQVERGGVKWLTASEIARIGVDEALGRLVGRPIAR